MNNGFKNKYPKYVNDSFTVYTSKKKQMFLSVPKIKDFGMLQDIIIDKTDSNDRFSINKSIIELFPNLNHLIIYTTPQASDDVIRTIY